MLPNEYKANAFVGRHWTALRLCCKSDCNWLGNFSDVAIGMSFFNDIGINIIYISIYIYIFIIYYNTFWENGSLVGYRYLYNILYIIFFVGS